jgi:predicted ATPase
VILGCEACPYRVHEKHLAWGVILRTLGGLDLQGSGFTRPKPLLLLGYLALEGARDRHFLADVFFSGAKDRMNSLRTTLKRLRQEVPGALESEGDPLRVALVCDAQTLLSTLDAGELEQGAQLYAGPFLAGVHLPDWGVELEEWVYATREFVASRVRGALLTLAERAAQRDGFEAGARLAERACWLEGAPDPEPEEFARMGTLLAAGDSPLLVRLHQQAREFGIELGQSIGAARQALRGPELPEASVSRVTLPVRGTSFVGRVGDCAEILAWLARPEVRLLTLVGPGGIGKTRLALEVARTARVREAAAFVSLEGVASIRHLPKAIADAVGVKLPEDQPPFPALLNALEMQSVLLVLDNAEHLLEGTPYLSQLLHECQNVKLLVTSRERLGLEEEWVWTVEGLPVPSEGASFEDAMGFEAVQLFAQRAKRARLNFSFSPDDLPSVRRVCERVGGSPLGIELAAAWVKLMPVSEIATEIDRDLGFLEATDRDVPERHHSVRTVFEQTWERLTFAERQVFSKLSVFRGGFTREAAGTVAGASATTLASLVDKSLVRVADHGRYDIHALLQQFARERLAQNAGDETPVKAAHGQFYLGLSTRFFEAIQRLDEEKLWVVRIDQDLENIRAALTRWLERGEVETALRCVLNLRNYWTRTGRTREARRWLAEGFTQSRGVAPEVREWALTTDGEMAYLMHDYGEARRRLEEALGLVEARGSSAPLTLLHLGNVANNVGDLETARQRFEQALHGFRAQKSLPGVAAALNNLGTILVESENHQGALEMFERALHAKREAGGDADSVLQNLGNLHWRLGHLETSKSFYLQALQGLVERGFYNHIPEVFEGLAFVASSQGFWHRAALLFGASEAQREAFNTVRSESERAQFEPSMTPIRDALGAEAFAADWAEGRALRLEEAVTYATEGEDAG